MTNPSVRKKKIVTTEPLNEVKNTAMTIESRIYRTVFESVMNQRLKPGVKLPEAALCEHFSASRAVVRTTLQKLAHDHIVELRPNRGAIVAIPTPKETQTIFEARRSLEAAIIRLVVKNATKTEINALHAQLSTEPEAVHRFDQPSWVRLASEFHLLLAELSHNEILQRYLAELISRCSLIVALYEPPGNACCEHDEHVQVVDLIEKKQADAAVRAMEKHLLALEKNVCLERKPAEKSLAQLLGVSAI